MKSHARKNILNAAKAEIEASLMDRWETVHDAISKEREKDNPNTEILTSLCNTAQNISDEITEWKRSKKAKKKASIEWQLEEDGSPTVKQMKKSKKKTISNAKALDRVKKSQKDRERPRAGSWLQEGSLVVSRNQKVPMVVLEIRKSGYVQVLDGGFVRNLRELSLRPAFTED